MSPASEAQAWPRRHGAGDHARVARAEIRAALRTYPLIAPAITPDPPMSFWMAM